MATYDFTHTVYYFDLGAVKFLFQTNATPGTLEDGDPDTTFESGDTPTGGLASSGIPSSLTYLGTTVIDGETWPVFSGINSEIHVYMTQAPVAAPDPLSITSQSFTVCFAAGTAIETPYGSTAVEALSIGDMITTQDGRAVPVKWIGRQTLLRAFTPVDRFEPVRVSAGALGGGLPHTDLVLTADHALIIDGLAVNAGALVNGTTITRVPSSELPERVTYYHIETAAHDTILANGAAAETFVDYIGRRVFDNHAEYVALYGDEPVIAEMTLPRVSSRRQLPADLRARFGISDFADDVTADARAFLEARRVA